MVERQLPKLDTRVRFPSPAKLFIIRQLRLVALSQPSISERKSEQVYRDSLMFASVLRLTFSRASTRGWCDAITSGRPQTLAKARPDLPGPAFVFAPCPPGSPWPNPSKRLFEPLKLLSLCRSLRVRFFYDGGDLLGIISHDFHQPEFNALSAASDDENLAEISRAAAVEAHMEAKSVAAASPINAQVESMITPTPLATVLLPVDLTRFSVGASVLKWLF
jgi:hypothetical protein